MKYTSLALLLVFLAACSAEQNNLAQQLVSERSDAALESSVPSLEEMPAAKPVEAVNNTPASVEEVAPAPIVLSVPEPEPASIPEPAPVYVLNESQNETEEEPETFSNITVDVAHTPKRAPLYYFLDLFSNKVDSYKFTYNGNYYSLKGTKYKIVLSNPGAVREVTFPNGTYRRQFYYDTVYVDRIAKNAIGYCEGHTSNVNHQCATLELYDLAYELSFKEYLLVLPEDWLFSYLNREPISFEEDKYYISGRSTIQFVFNETNATTELNFDQTTGLVLRADQKVGTTLVRRYDYEDLAANTIREVDVVHRSRSEIDSADTFYR